MPKLLCFGDVHLGQGSEYGSAPGARLRDQAAVLLQIADLAIEEAVDGILCAGDVFEGPGVPPEQLDVFARFLDRLQGRIPVLSLVGNSKHDAAMREVNGLAIFNHIDGIQVVTEPELVRFAGCQIACLPWVHPGRLIARLGSDVPRDEVNAAVAELLLEIASDLFMQRTTGIPTILLGHWSVTGAALPNGLPVADLREPVISAADLDAIGFDHVVLGHIHKQQRVGERGFYVGSPMPLNHGEAGHPEEHGVVIVHTDETEDVDFYAAQCIPIESRRFATIDFDCTDELQARWLESAIEHPSMIDPALVADAVVRFRYRASAEQQGRINIAALRQALIDAGAAVVKIQPDIVRADRARVDIVDEQLDELAALDLYIEANAIEPALADRMRAKTAQLLEAAA